MTIFVLDVSGEQLFKWKVPKITIDTHIRHTDARYAMTTTSLSFATFTHYAHCIAHSLLDTKHPNIQTVNAFGLFIAGVGKKNAGDQKQNIHTQQRKKKNKKKILKYTDQQQMVMAIQSMHTQWNELE